MEKGIFERNVPGSTARLASSTVGIAGCGGIGSNVAVILIRAGVGRLILADHDVVEECNLNRQHFFRKDLGRVKVEALAEYLLDINPEADVATRRVRLTAENLAGVFGEANVLVEAFDRAEDKHWLLDTWCTAFPGRPVVAVSGISGLGKSSEIVAKRSGDIYIIGDGKSDPGIGLCAARVSLAAAMQANTVIALLTGSEV